MLESDDVEMDKAFQSTYNLLGSVIKIYNYQNSVMFALTGVRSGGSETQRKTHTH